MSDSEHSLFRDLYARWKRIKKADAALPSLGMAIDAADRVALRAAMRVLETKLLPQVKKHRDCSSGECPLGDMALAHDMLRVVDCLDAWASSSPDPPEMDDEDDLARRIARAMDRVGERPGTVFAVISRRPAKGRKRQRPAKADPRSDEFQA